MIKFRKVLFYSDFLRYLRYFPKEDLKIVGFPITEEEKELWKDSWEKGNFVNLVYVYGSFVGISALFKTQDLYLTTRQRKLREIEGYEEYVLLKKEARGLGIYSQILRQYFPLSKKLSMPIFSVPTGKEKEQRIEAFADFLLMTVETARRIIETEVIIQHIKKRKKLPRKLLKESEAMSKTLVYAWEKWVRKGTAKKLGIEVVEGTPLYIIFPNLL